MKTFDKKDVFSWSNSEEAKTYIGKTGYFNNDFEGMKRAIELGAPAVLGRVDTNSIWCFEGLGVSLCFGLFLPTDKVKEVEEKKWREFRTFEEFFLVVGSLGCHVRYRQKDDISNEFFSVVDSFNYKARTFTIGAHIYGFNELFTRYEFYKNQEWYPFGVLDES